MKLQFELFDDNNKSNKKEIKKHEPNKIIEEKIDYLKRIIDRENDTELYTWYGIFNQNQEVEKGLNGENYYVTIIGATYVEARKQMSKLYQTKYKELLKHDEMDFKNKTEHLLITIERKEDYLLCMM